MAVLPEQDRLELWAELMRRYSVDGETIGVTKPELRAAVDAIDDFMDANAAAINQALPQPARGVLTTAQKAILLTFVVERRYLVGV